MSDGTPDDRPNPDERLRLAALRVAAETDQLAAKEIDLHAKGLAILARIEAGLEACRPAGEEAARRKAAALLALGRARALWLAGDPQGSLAAIGRFYEILAEAG